MASEIRKQIYDILWADVTLFGYIKFSLISEKISCRPKLYLVYSSHLLKYTWPLCCFTKLRHYFSLWTEQVQPEEQAAHSPGQLRALVGELQDAQCRLLWVLRTLPLSHLQDGLLLSHGLPGLLNGATVHRAQTLSKQRLYGFTVYTQEECLLGINWSHGFHGSMD